MNAAPELCWIRVKLTQWGRMVRAVGGGYPSMATTEKARVGRGGSFDGPSLPDDLAAIDYHVTNAPNNHKMILVECYTKGGDYKDHAARLRIPVHAYYRRRNRAEVYLNTALRVQMD